jgi:hypothetical protein
MRRASLLIVLLTSTSAAAQGFTWEKRDDGRTAVLPDNTLELRGGDTRTTTTVLVLTKPKVPSHQYRLLGQIKFENVVGDGYVEMLNLFPGRGEFFTRTLAQGGSMGKLSGASDWRDLELPFMSEPGLLPEKLTVNVVLPGAGTVWLKPMRMEAFTAAGALDWLPGTIIGVVMGLAGALVGTLAAFRSTRQAAWLLSLLAMAASVIMLVLGIVALAQGWSYGTWYSLILGGGVGCVVFLASLAVIRKRLADDELRRMQALDG